MSVTVNGFSQHMISYYSVEDVMSGKLRTPSTIPELSALEISPEYLHKQNFRFPPMIEVGQDGVPRYRWVVCCRLGHLLMALGENQICRVRRDRPLAPGPSLSRITRMCTRRTRCLPSRPRSINHKYRIKTIHNSLLSRPRWQGNGQPSQCLSLFRLLSARGRVRLPCILIALVLASSSISK
jgi:hypothetical protein